MPIVGGVLEILAGFWMLFCAYVIGGLMAWIANRYEDPEKAKELLIFGLIWSFILYLFFWFLFNQLFSFL